MVAGGRRGSWLPGRRSPSFSTTTTTTTTREKLSTSSFSLPRRLRPLPRRQTSPRPPPATGPAAGWRPGSSGTPEALCPRSSRSRKRARRTGAPFLVFLLRRRLLLPFLACHLVAAFFLPASSGLTNTACPSAIDMNSSMTSVRTQPVRSVSPSSAERGGREEEEGEEFPPSLSSLSVALPPPLMLLSAASSFAFCSSDSVE